jgi:cysteinyl-tRNA synthetase
MSWKHLGETFDIHGGGIDLVFPHHENEIAQTCCAFGHPVMANLWMHNGFLQVEGKKMSKSLGNFLTIRQLLDDWPGEVLRFNMLRTHYRQPIDWTVKGLEESHTILKGWYDSTDMAAAPLIEGEFALALNDDLNTPKAIAALHALEGENLAGSLVALGFSGNLERGNAPPIDCAKVETLIAERAAARTAKDFAAADRLRGEIEAMGVIVKDAKDKTTGALVTTWEPRR